MIVKLNATIRIYPNKTQEDYLIQNIGNNRFYFNQMLEFRNNYYEEHKKSPSNSEYKEKLDSLRKTYPWLKISSASSLQQTLRNLDDAFKRFFKNQNDFPTFKSKKKSKLSFREPNNNGTLKVIENRIYFSKMREGIKFKGSLPKYDKITSVTIKLTPTGKWFAIICMEVENRPKLKTGKKVGIDLGLTDFLITSDGLKISQIKASRIYQIKLAKEQRKLSLMRVKLVLTQKDLSNCKNYQKQKLKVAKVHEKIANVRKDFLNKLSTNLINCYDFIALEGLNVKGMLKNHKLAFSISDASWSMFVGMLKYKAEWFCKTIKQINRFAPTSKTCSNCGAYHKNIVNSLKIREWKCPDCGTFHDRDVNAAKNILNLALI